MSVTPFRYLCALALAALATGTVSAQTPAAKGPAVGEPIPAFSARDQFGHPQTRASLSGPNGLVLLFFRSADW